MQVQVQVVMQVVFWIDLHETKAKSVILQRGKFSFVMVLFHDAKWQVINKSRIIYEILFIIHNKKGNKIILS